MQCLNVIKSEMKQKKIQKKNLENKKETMRDMEDMEDYHFYPTSLNIHPMMRDREIHVKAKSEN